MESEWTLCTVAESQREEETMSVDHLLLPVCQCRRDLRHGLRLSDSSKSSSTTLHAAAAGLTAGWPAATSARRLAPRGKRGDGEERAVCPLRKVGISPCWISFERWCCSSSSIKHPYPRGVEGQRNQDLTRQMPCCRCLLLMMVVAACMYSAARPPPNMQCRSFPLAA